MPKFWVFNVFGSQSFVNQANLGEQHLSVCFVRTSQCSVRSVETSSRYLMTDRLTDLFLEHSRNAQKYVEIATQCIVGGFRGARIPMKEAHLI